MALFRGKEILVLEDAADLLKQISTVLEADGAMIDDARTARSGITAALEMLPHLVIADLSLTGAGALQFLSEIKKIPQLARIPVLALGRAQDKEAIVRATQLGAVDCLLKPFSAAVLIEKVEKLLGQDPFRPRHFAEGERLQARLTVPAEIVTIDETGFLLEAPVMLGKETEIQLVAPLLEELDCAEATTRTTSRAPRPVAEGGYVNEINLMGIGPKTTKIIREYIRARAEEAPKK